MTIQETYERICFLIKKKVGSGIITPDFIVELKLALKHLEFQARVRALKGLKKEEGND